MNFDRLDAPEQALDAVDRYVILLCARQVLEQLEKHQQDFAAAHARDLQALGLRLAKSEQVRPLFTFGEPAERKQFLDWFERWFPDAFALALAAVAVVFVACLAAGSSVLDSAQRFGSGFWDLVAFTIQMSMIVVTWKRRPRESSSAAVVNKALAMLPSLRI